MYCIIRYVVVYYGARTRSGINSKKGEVAGMRMILDLKDEVVKDMQDYCAHHNITVSQLIENMFEMYIKEPVIAFSEIDDDKDFWNFTSLLENYLTEAMHDIKALSKSTMAFDTDEAMAKVFKRLIEKHIKQGFVILDLYKTYKEALELTER